MAKLFYEALMTLKKFIQGTLNVVRIWCFRIRNQCVQSNFVPGRIYFNQKPVFPNRLCTMAVANINYKLLFHT